MSLVIVKSGEAMAVSAGTAIVAKTTVVNLLNNPPLPAGAPISETITKFPLLSMGRLRFTLGVGGGNFALQMVASDMYPPMLRPVPDLRLSGPGTYLWPAGRKSLAYGLQKLSGPAPSGTLNVDLLQFQGRVAGDKATGVLGLVQPGASVPPGTTMILVAAGSAIASCSGGWTKNDALCATANGALRKIKPGETGLDRVGYATADQADGDINCPVTVDLALI